MNGLKANLGDHKIFSPHVGRMKIITKSTTRHCNSSFSTMMAGKYENKLVYTKPLDVLFARLQVVLSCLVPEFRKEDAKIVQKSVLNAQTHDDRIGKLYHALNAEELEHPDNASRPSQEISVIRFFLKSLIRIQELTTVSQPEGNDTKELLMISLYDLKIFNALVTFLVIDGIHSCVPRGVGVPIGLRTKQFGVTISEKSVPMKEDMAPASVNQLWEILECLVKLLGMKGDVRDLLLLGPYTVDFMSAAATVAFHPSIPKDSRFKGFKTLSFIQSQIDSYSLYLHLTSLLRPKTPTWLIGGVSHSLAMIPLKRSDGVKALLEFISGAREKEDIQMADLDKATKILKSIPKNVSLEKYSSEIGKQIAKIIASPGSSLAVPTIQIVTALYSQKPEIINSGLKKILQERLSPLVTCYSAGETILVTQESLDEALACLYLIATKSHAVDLTQALTDSIILPLWTLVCYLNKSKKSSELATSTLVSTLQQAESKTSLYIQQISGNLTTINCSQYWKYSSSTDGGCEIRQLRHSERTDLISGIESNILAGNISSLFDDIETRVKKFAEILDLLDDSEVSSFFVLLLSEWMIDQQNEDPFRALTKSRVLESIMEKSKKKLLSSSQDIITVVHATLDQYQTSIEEELKIHKRVLKLEVEGDQLKNLISVAQADSEDEDEEQHDSDDEEEGTGSNEKEQIVMLCFSLISSILMELDVDTNSTGKNETITRLQQLVPFVKFIQKYGSSFKVKSQARLCNQKLGLISWDLSVSEPLESNSSQRKFLTAIQLMEDPSPPVQAHGMHLLRLLVDSKDMTVDFRLALKLFLSKLKDKDSFIYLSAIKGLEALASQYRFEVVNPLLDTYRDPKKDLDLRLRVGEVILKFIETYGPVLQAEQALTLLKTLISIVSRHSENGPPDLLRMSAMSIIGAFFESAPGVARIGIDDSLDCAIQILRIETQPDQTIMRRSAILLISAILHDQTEVQVTSHDLDDISTRLNIALQDEDPLVRSQAMNTLEMIGTSRFRQVLSLT